jgi:hypothetical protein
MKHCGDIIPLMQYRLIQMDAAPLATFGEIARLNSIGAIIAAA